MVSLLRPFPGIPPPLIPRNADGIHHGNSSGLGAALELTGTQTPKVPPWGKAAAPGASSWIQNMVARLSRTRRVTPHHL